MSRIQFVKLWKTAGLKSCRTEASLARSTDVMAGAIGDKVE